MISRIASPVAEDEPKIGNCSTKATKEIPIKRTAPDNKTTGSLRSNNFTERPIAKPKSPVVKGKMNNSLGCSINSKPIATAYVKNPLVNEIQAATTIGKVEKGLMR